MNMVGINKNMKNKSKGIVKMSINDIITIRKTGDTENFLDEIVLNDFIIAANESNYIVEFEIFKSVHELPKKSTYGNIVKEIDIKIKNYDQISFMMSMPNASHEEKLKFKSWLKFWTTLTKLGYNVR